jgi:hypothetical protein
MNNLLTTVLLFLGFLSLGFTPGPALGSETAPHRTNLGVEEESPSAVLDRDWAERHRAMILRGDFAPLYISPAVGELEAFREDLLRIDGIRWTIVGGMVGASTLIGALIPVFLDLKAVGWYWHRGAPVVGGIMGFSIGAVVGEMIAYFVYQSLLEESFNNHILKAIKIYNDNLGK